jgi:hypothetical protein
VDDLEKELSLHHFNIISPPNSPGNGVKVAMIKHNGVLVELIEFTDKKIRQ